MKMKSSSRYCSCLHIVLFSLIGVEVVSALDDNGDIKVIIKVHNPDQSPIIKTQGGKWKTTEPYAPETFTKQYETLSYEDTSRKHDHNHSTMQNIDHKGARDGPLKLAHGKRTTWSWGTESGSSGSSYSVGNNGGSSGGGGGAGKGGGKGGGSIGSTGSNSYGGGAGKGGGKGGGSIGSTGSYSYGHGGGAGKGGGKGGGSIGSTGSYSYGGGAGKGGGKGGGSIGSTGSYSYGHGGGLGGYSHGGGSGGYGHGGGLSGGASNGGGGGIGLTGGYGHGGGLGGVGMGMEQGGAVGMASGRIGEGGYKSWSGNIIFSQRLKEYIKDVLQMHKKYRKIHNAKPLRLSKRLTKGAMRYAKKLAKKFKRIKHSRLFSDIKVGENLLMSAVPLTGATVVKTWYDQVYNYDFKNQIGKNDAPYLAFTQVVWKGTRRIGVGRAVGKVNGQWFAFYCVRYKPSGFYGSVENFKENVEKGKFNVFQFMNQGWSFGMNGYASWGMEDLYTFASSALNAHNQLRSLHKVPALTLDSDLCIKAMKKITETKRSVLRSEPGMNVFEICKGTISGAGVTKEWYRDVCYYDFDKQDSRQATKSQFRQVIWKDTTNFGISYKVVKNENEKKCLRVVALYSAAMEETNANLKKQVKKGKFKGCHNGAFTYKGGIVIT